MSVDNLRGQQLGQYELRELLGAGGMGAVYRAFQVNLKREVAIKVLPPHFANDPDYLQRFNREAEISASLEHAHIVPVYDFGIADDIIYVVMRLLTGGTLAQRLQQSLREKRPLPSLDETAEMLRQLASALDYAHSRNVIHRDIKPGNIMFDHHGSAYLVDFGIAKMMSGSTASITGTGAVGLGTPAYMPPEQWRGLDLTPAADQYALAVAVYSMITGRLPFEADTPYQLMHKHLYDEPTPPQMFREDLPPAVSVVLSKAMAKEPTDRFASAGEFSRAFTGAAYGVDTSPTGFFEFPVAQQGGGLRTPTPGRTPMRTPTPSRSSLGAEPSMVPPPRRSRGALWVGLFVALLALGAVAFFGLQALNNSQSGTAAPPTQSAAQPSETAPTEQPLISVIQTDTPTGEPSTAAPTSTATEEAVAIEPTNTPTEEVVAILSTDTPTVEVSPTTVPTSTPDAAGTSAALQLQAAQTELFGFAQTATPLPGHVTPTITPVFTPNDAQRALTEVFAIAQTATPIPTRPTRTPRPTEDTTAAAAVQQTNDSLALLAAKTETTVAILAQSAATTTEPTQVVQEPTSTDTIAPSATLEPSLTPTLPPTETPAPSATIEPSLTPTPPPTDTPAPTATPLPTETPLPSATSTDTEAPLLTPTETPAATFTETQPPTATETFTPALPPTLAPLLGFSLDNPPTSNAQWQPFVDTYTRSYEGIAMVLVPAGCFLMGSTQEQIDALIAQGARPDFFDDEMPQHPICFSAPFWLDRYEVTNEAFDRLGGSAAHANSWPDPQQPRAHVTWAEAEAFCELRGARLPTEAEWEYAARGPDDLYLPWGNDFIDSNLAYAGNSQNQVRDVGSYPAGVSWVGAYDMQGNVWEYTSTLHQPYPYNPTDGREDLTLNGQNRVLRGQSIMDNNPGIHSADRSEIPTDFQDFFVGFRCARSYEGAQGGSSIVTPTLSEQANTGAETATPSVVCQVHNGGTSGVNVRAEPSAQAAIIGTIPSGGTIDVHSIQVGSDGFAWYGVEVDSNGTLQSGWVHSNVVIQMTPCR